MAKWRAVVIASMGLVIYSHLLSCAHAERPRSSRLARILVGRNEVNRQKQLAVLENDVARQIEVMDDLVYGLEYHAEAIAGGKQIPPSFSELVDLVGGINRPQARDAVIKLLDSERVEVAIIAADVLGEKKIYEAIEPLTKQVQRPEFEILYGFRFNLVRALVRMEHPDAFDFLGKLSTKLEGQLARELNEQLDKVDVNDFRGDEERFASWNESRKPVFAKPASFKDYDDKIKFARNQYYGIDIYAKRLLFILDQSGSMNKRLPSGTRLINAKQELAQAISGLPPDTEFGILFFNDTVRSWRDHLVEASEENKREAYQFIRGVVATSKTNTYGALRKAMEFDDQLETVFLLTDGKPTTGPIVAPGAIVNDILQRNRTRHLTINTIGIGVEAKMESFLKSLSKNSNGQSRFSN